MKSILCTVLFITLFAIEFVATVSLQKPIPITVNKCCGAGKILTRENYDCFSNEDGEWWPLIFQVMKNAIFEPKGHAPRFMKFHEMRPNCESPDFYEGSHKMVLFSNGSLYLSEKHKVIKPQDFCVDRNTALVCDPDTSLLIPTEQLLKIRKCCVANSFYKPNENTCSLSHEFTFTDGQLLNSSQTDVVFGFPECKLSKYTIAETFKESSLNQETNSLFLETGQNLDWKDFCLERVGLEESGDKILPLSVFTCADHLAVSQITDDFSHTDIRFILFPIGLLISVVFLLATLATRYMLPSHHHLLHWRCQTFYVSCLLIGDIFLALTQLFGRNVNGFACVSIAICMHFFFLSAFFWLNTMCFNIYWTFRDFRPHPERGQEKLRLRIYKVYAFGVPLLISGTAATLHHIRKNSLSNDTYLQPRFCESEYWFAGNLEKLAFFYGPMGILLLVNLILFASTARQLTCGLWKREDVKSTTERTTLGRICIKLVIVMGVTWIADVLSWAHGVWFGGPHYLWLITDLINTLQGVFIFIVIGCQSQISNVLKQMWRSKDIQFRQRRPEGGNQNSSSSQVASSLGESVSNNTFTTSNAKISAESAF